MASLSSLLPKPRNNLAPSGETAPKLEKQISQLVAARSKDRIPPYGSRKDFRPRNPEDFGNGGAFPEIHIHQFPLNMGRKKERQTEKSGGALTLQVDSDGKVKYDAIARQGHSDDRTIHTSLKDMIPLKERKDVDAEKLAMDRPDEEEVMSVAEKTRAALEKIVNGKIKSAKPTTTVTTTGTIKKPTYIRYTPVASEVSGSGSKQRIIRMTDAPVDPLMPPKFTHKKVPRAPTNDDAPVMHSPPRKLTAEEQAEWVIPPCISNWKNTKGYTVPLDKRLAADGRGLQDVSINDNFAKFAEALYAADRHAREEVRQRNLMQQKLAQKQKDAEEDKLRDLAQRAREERAGLRPSATADASLSSSNRPTAASLMNDSDSSEESGSESDDDYRRREEADEASARERDELRRERKKKHEREMRMSHMGAATKAKQMARDSGRDISERIALGLAKPTKTSEGMFDARLFNTTEGINSGFKDEESNAVYDQPFQKYSSSSIYKFKNKDQNEILGSLDSNDLDEAINRDKFGINRKAFQGAEGGEGSSGPVEFEKETIGGQKSKSTDKDVFGLDTFLNKAKRGKRTRDDSDDEEQDRRRR